MNNIFQLIDGLEPVDPKILDAFRKEMQEKVIPEIVKNQTRQTELARESRHWIVGNNL